jgi:hypothetical protein
MKGRGGVGGEHRHLLVALSLGALAGGCGASAPPPAAEAAPSEQHGDEKPVAVSVEAEVGALDELKVKEAFEHAASKLTACFAKGMQRIPYLAGDVRFVLRIGPAGSTRAAFVKDSTLGDRETEECMLGVLKSASWPAPVGGKEGRAENSFSFEPGNDERPPVPWKPEQLGAPFRRAKPALTRCRRGAGAMKATMYVETDGKATGIGVSTSDERGEAAVACVVDTLRGLTFPSPGSYASKVSVVID